MSKKSNEANTGILELMKGRSVPSSKIENTKSISSLYDEYSINLNSINQYHSKFGSLAVDEDKNTLNSVAEYVNDILKDIGLDDDEVGAQLTSKLGAMFLHKISKMPKPVLNNYELLSQGSFLLLNNYFEYLITEIITYYHVKFKSTFDNKDFKVSLKEISEFENVDDLSNHLIFKEIEKLLIELSFDKLLEYLENVIDISLHRELIQWDKIIEARERRHIIVHNSSIVNRKYIIRTGNPFSYEIGQKVNITNEYFNRLMLEFKLAGSIILFNCWGKWEKDNATSAIQKILHESYEFLLTHNNDFALRLCKYADAIQSRDDDQQDYLLRIKFNKGIALKRLNNNKELKGLLKTIPTGTSSPIFKIAYKLLNGDINGIEALMKQAIILEEARLYEYLTWPIFEFARKDKNLDKRLINCFPEELTEISNELLGIEEE